MSEAAFRSETAANKAVYLLGPPMNTDKRAVVLREDHARHNNKQLRSLVQNYKEEAAVLQTEFTSLKQAIDNSKKESTRLQQVRNFREDQTIRDRPPMTRSKRMGQKDWTPKTPFASSWRLQEQYPPRGRGLSSIGPIRFERDKWSRISTKSPTKTPPRDRGPGSTRPIRFANDQWDRGAERTSPPTSPLRITTSMKFVNDQWVAMKQEAPTTASQWQSPLE
ncbi:hypothetical protein CEXT_182211 [Caerostris extrusa]|uniref:Uncharacterized protein n=1 Tax=Caerostris extrusa TaxID=172846 RepID=A0AAV4N127_CAEEX|nr:hypothetical protein CEXT_182211 [Caerostris extrusa]